MPRIHIPNQNHRTYPGIYGREICEGTVNLQEFWQEATNGERRRLVELLVASVHLYVDRVEIEIRTEGVQSIMEEFEHEADND